METLEQQLQLKCYRCGHQWLRRTLNSLPKQCPLCHSSLWNENILENDEAKAHVKEEMRTLHPEIALEEFERLFDRVYANTLAMRKGERNALVRAVKAVKGQKRRKK
jgi:hypothetical protein